MTESVKRPSTFGWASVRGAWRLIALCGSSLAATHCSSSGNAVARTEAVWTEPAGADELLDPDLASAEDLLRLPHFSAALAVEVTKCRPFKGPLDFEKYLIERSFTAPQRSRVYARAFVRVDLDRCTPEEILLIPDAGPRMVREIFAHRPWISWERFEIEIGKSLDPLGIERLRKYCFLPLDANEANEDQLRAIPGMRETLCRRILSERPFKDTAAFESTMTQFAGPKESARLARYLVFR